MDLIVISNKDLASKNIGNILLNKFAFKPTGESFEGSKLYKFRNFLLCISSSDVLDLDYLDKFFKVDKYIIASRHSSKEKIPSLTTHSPGNFRKVPQFGARKLELAFSSAVFSKEILKSLKEIQNNRSLKYEVCLEVTHHGPSNLKKPINFVEVGSSEENWGDMEACNAVAESLIHALSLNSKYSSAIGIGGTHYAPKFTDYQLHQNLAIGHICPKYMVDNLDNYLINEMIKKTVPEPKVVLIEKKSLNSTEKQKVLGLLDDKGLEINYL